MLFGFPSYITLPYHFPIKPHSITRQEMMEELLTSSLISRTSGIPSPSKFSIPGDESWRENW